MKQNYEIYQTGATWALLGTVTATPEDLDAVVKETFGATKYAAVPLEEEVMSGERGGE